MLWTKPIERHVAMARKARVFTSSEIKEIFRLFDAGESTAHIGQRQMPPCSGQLIGRVLKARLGDLRAVKALAKMRGLIRREGLRHEEYREGFHAGYLMGLTHVNLHGLGRAHDYCNKTLLPWREAGLENPPEFHGSP